MDIQKPPPSAAKEQNPKVQAPTPRTQAASSVSQGQPQHQVKNVVPKKKRSFPKIDWLFILACVVVVVQVLLLVLINNGKQEYSVLKKADADQIYFLQKVTTVSQEDIQNLEKSFLNEDNVVLFVQTLEQSRTIFDSFELMFTSDVPLGKDIQYLTFEVTATGSKENIQIFMHKLLGSTYAVEAAQVDISVDKEDTTKWDLSLQGNIYLQNGK
jgi:hypothetical protein